MAVMCPRRTATAPFGSLFGRLLLVTAMGADGANFRSGRKPAFGVGLSDMYFPHRPSQYSGDVAAKRAPSFRCFEFEHNFAGKNPQQNFVC